MKDVSAAAGVLAVVLLGDIQFSRYFLHVKAVKNKINESQLKVKSQVDV